MPGLPRKSTANQFRKLMKKSGKARTNKAAGGTDPSSRKISTYEQFCLMRETLNLSDIDPYGEEDWNENWIEKIRKIFDFLEENTNKDCVDIGYVLIFISDPIVSIELLKDEDDELVEDEHFFFGIYFENEDEGSLVTRYKMNFGDGQSWKEISTEEDIFEILKKLENVIKYIKMYKEKKGYYS